jgi:hypothetical protein
MENRNVVFCYLLKENFNDDIKGMAEISGISEKDLTSWRDGTKQPQKRTIEYLFNILYVPEFSIIKEFYQLDANEPIQTQLKMMFKGHEERSGIYAFYDSMANLLYVGKAKNLLEETYAAIGRDYHLEFPAGIQNSDIKRHEVVRFVSAYDVKMFENFDYPKHVESLILRISKPIMNKQIGLLSKAYPSLDE